MKHKPQTLTSWRSLIPAAIFAAVLTCGLFLPALPLAAQQEPPAPNGDSEARPSEKTANEVLSKVTDTVKSAQTLSCNMQQTLLMSGQKMLAAGRYVQGTGNRMRLEYRIFPASALNQTSAKQLKLGSEPTDVKDLKIDGALTQISDGSVLWSKWKNGPDTQITRRNIREILEAVKDIKNSTPADSLRSLGVGGLQTLISQLQVGMEFGAVKEQTINGNTVYILAGRWTQKTRQELFQIPDGDPTAQLPAFIPDYVRIYIDKAASLPRRIEYLKRHPNPEVKQAQPLAILDFRNLSLNATIDDSMFDFTKEESDEAIEQQDLTKQTIDAIKAAAEVTEKAEATSEAGDSPPQGEAKSGAAGGR